MRKTFILAVIACILGIVLLGGLAFYIPRELGSRDPEKDSEMFTGFRYSTESPDPSGSAMSGASSESGTGTQNGSAASESKEKQPGTTIPADTPALIGVSKSETESESGYSAGKTTAPGKTVSAAVTEHRIIWVGDSRTLGLQDALHKTERVDDDLFVGKVGEGIHWFQEEGISQMDEAIRENPNLPVVLNLGVNDPQLVDEYIGTYKEVFKAYPDSTFYILSVNPLDEEFLLEDGLVEEAVFEDINSLNVAKMNVKLKEEFASRYIDSASYLKSDGFDTVDGLHFSTETYLKIHDFVVKELFG